MGVGEGWQEGVKILKGFLLPKEKMWYYKEKHNWKINPKKRSVRNSHTICADPKGSRPKAQAWRCLSSPLLKQIPGWTFPLSLRGCNSKTGVSCPSYLPKASLTIPSGAPILFFLLSRPSALWHNTYFFQCPHIQVMSTLTSSSDKISFPSSLHHLSLPSECS